MISVRSMCRILMVHVSGFYAWLKEPLSLRAQELLRQTGLIRQERTYYGKVYGYRKPRDDLWDQGETCSENPAARLAAMARIVELISYNRRPGRYGGKLAVTAKNRLDRRSEVAVPGTVCVTDIIYIETLEGRLYLAVVIDLFSRRVVGWSLQSRITTDLALQLLLMAVWRPKSKYRLMIHSHQDSQFSSREWQSFLRHYNLDASKSLRGNNHDDAVAESFFPLRKCERMRRRTFLTREASRQDVFRYIA